MEKRAINILMLSVLMSLAVLLMPVRVSAETDTAPTVMYKLINHDCIKLKWNEVTGADGYYIYRTDIGTGKTVKYKSIVKGTDVTIKNLSAETEYIFYVEPMTGKNGKTTVGQRSAGTKLTTPKEWYYYDDSVVDDERRAIKSRFYRTDYSKGKKEKINLGDIKYVDEIIYYNGWYYVIGNLDAIKSGSYPYGAVNNRMCIARIREDGTQKEILFDDFFHADDILYAYIITDDAIYLQQQCYNTLEENDKELYYFDAELCWLKKISLKTGEIETIALPCPYSWFDVHDGYIYYGYNDIYKYSKNNKKYLIYGDQGVYISAWYDRQTVKLIDAEKYYSYCYMMEENGDTRQLIYKSVYDKRVFGAYIYNDLKIFEESKSICTMSINNDNYKKIFSSNEYIYILNIQNDYIYFFEDKGLQRNPKYGRIKIDGTDLTTQDTPFEWYY